MHVPVFAVIGGGEDGAFYVRQLRRAVMSGGLSTDVIVVIDHDSGCRVAREAIPPVRVEVAEWSEWLEQNLARLPTGSHLVPHHWAPHLLRGWLESAAARVRSTLRRQPSWQDAVLLPGLHCDRLTREGDRALSYADWVCPRTCIEPALCPHTRGRRNWSLASRLAENREMAEDRVVFRCLHFAFGVATVPVTEILAAREQFLDALRRGSKRVLVATASHCHGLATMMETA